MLQKLWNDQSGVIVSAEIVLIMTILVIGVITGLTSLRDGLITELADVGAAIGAVDQSFSFGGVCAHAASTSFAFFFNVVSFCDVNGTTVATNSRCIVINHGHFAGPIHGHDTGHSH